MAASRLRLEMYVATVTFYVVIDGKQTMVKKGRDLVRAGHPLLERYPDNFKPVHVRFDVEQATAAPGEKRGEPAPPPHSPPAAPQPAPRHAAIAHMAGDPTP
jgi:hypothetical protein